MDTAVRPPAAARSRQLVRVLIVLVALAALGLTAVGLLARAYINSQRSAIAHYFWTFYPEVQKPTDQLVVDFDYWLEKRIDRQDWEKDLTFAELRENRLAAAQEFSDRWTALLATLKGLDAPAECRDLEMAYTGYFQARRARTRALIECWKTGDPTSCDRFVESAGEITDLGRTANREYLRMLRWPRPDWWPFG